MTEIKSYVTVGLVTGVSDAKVLLLLLLSEVIDYWHQICYCQRVCLLSGEVFVSRRRCCCAGEDDGVMQCQGLSLSSAEGARGWRIHCRHSEHNIRKGSVANKGPTGNSTKRSMKRSGHFL